MITFARGLVLRRGERALEFVRDLGDGRVQFQYQDNFEPFTIKLSKAYSDVLEGSLVPVIASAAGEQQPVSSSALPVQLTPRQEWLVEFRMRFVRAVLRSPCQSRSRAVCSAVSEQIWPECIAAWHEEGVRPRFKQPSGAAVEVWVTKYLRSDQNPFFLLDRRAMRVRPRRVHLAVELLVDEVIAKVYLKLRGASVKETHRQVCSRVVQLNRREARQLTAPSERTLNRRILAIPPYIRDFKRIGPAYARNKWRYSLAGDQSTRIMERVEIDHTLLDIWVLDPITGVPLGRPWITLLIDRFSGYLLGFYVSFYGPSSATVARAMKVAIVPKDDWLEILDLGAQAAPWTAMGIAETYVVDNGLEFHSAAFKRIAWELRADLLFNAVRHPWMKAGIERAIMESNRVLPNAGRVYAPIKNAVSPKPGESAAIVFDDLCICLLEWASQTYPLRINQKTLCRPIDLWEEGRLAMPPAMFPSTLAQIDLLCGLNAERRVDGDGIWFEWQRYNSVELQEYRRTHGAVFKSEIRFNPDDLRQIHVLLPKSKSWLRVPAQWAIRKDGGAVSLVQVQAIRTEAGNKLNRANAAEEFEKAFTRLQDRWQAATKRGLRLRKNSELIRLQGLTSAPMDPSGPIAVNGEVDMPLQLSPAMVKNLPQVVADTAFSLEDY